MITLVENQVQGNVIEILLKIIDPDIRLPLPNLIYAT